MAPSTTPTSAAASLGIASLVGRPTTSGVLLGASSGGAWLQVEGEVIVLSPPGPTRLPNGVAMNPFPEPEGQWAVGDGQLRIGDADFTVIRWWDPTPALRLVTRETLAANVVAAAELIRCPARHPLESDLVAGDLPAIQNSLLDLMGNGPGLTPQGDDVLVGVLAGLRLLGRAVGAEWGETLVGDIESMVLAEAPLRTTELSVALLRHAVAGEVAAPVAGFLHALTGRRSLSDAVDDLRNMGDTSGMATACGVLIAAKALAREDIDGR